MKRRLAGLRIRNDHLLNIYLGFSLVSAKLMLFRTGSSQRFVCDAFAVQRGFFYPSNVDGFFVISGG